VPSLPKSENAQVSSQSFASHDVKSNDISIRSYSSAATAASSSESSPETPPNFEICAVTLFGIPKRCRIRSMM
jgi:hypothetical protein